MIDDATSKLWYPATITSLSAEPRSYNITTRKGVSYRKTQAYLKPYKLQRNKFEAEHSVSHPMAQFSDIWMVKQSECKKS